jgi:stage IV sporulation protein B
LDNGEATRTRKAIGVIIAALIIGACFTPQYQRYINIPDSLRIVQGERHQFEIGFPLDVYIRSNQEGAVRINGNLVAGSDPKVNLASPLAIEPMNTGRINLEFRLFNVIPVRKLVVDVIPQIRLVPGGHAIGVIMRSQGVMVVGYSSIRDQNGKLVCPARDAGVNIGDVIMAVDGKPVTGDNAVAVAVDASGQRGENVIVEIKREGRFMRREIRPVYDRDTGRHRIGLYIRDGAAGVGTLTFYDPTTLYYGALGHIIADMDTNKPINIEAGEIVPANISGIQQGRRGQPGEKMGAFADTAESLGSIDKNTDFGIIGILRRPAPNPHFPEAIPIASMSQVETGPADIYTVVDGAEIRKYAVEIIRLTPQGSPGGKGMVIKVTDPELLAKTGGIVQGMSGSPVVQNGKLVGAVTHVFVNDPTRGYGVFIEWMLMETGIVNSSNVGMGAEQQPAAAALLLANLPTQIAVFNLPGRNRTSPIE